MKYFQSIADIEKHYKDMIREFGNEKYGRLTLETWGVSWEEKDAILEELEVLRYLIACQHGVTRLKDVEKPSIEIVNRCFNRHLGFLELIDDCNQWNVNKHSSKLVRNEYKACRHYLFKFSCPGWVKYLPDKILSLENKHSKRINL